MQKRTFFLILIFIFAAFLQGCATTPKQQGSEKSSLNTILAVTANLRFSDVPVPAGFKLNKEQSFVFQTDNLRVALLKYTGRAQQQDLVDFFKEQMAYANWDLLNVLEYNKSVLNFDRGSQSCIITIEPQGAKKILTIAVAPKATRKTRDYDQEQVSSGKNK